MNKTKEYYFIDINITNNKLVNWGISNTASLTGETPDKNIHRIFLTKGQYNKLVQNLKKL
jgi:hypothetical protein